MKRPQLVSQGSLNRMLRTAAELWERRQFPEFFQTVERASRLDPANSGILLELGGAYIKRFQYADAERCFERAIRVAPRRAEALAGAGRKCRESGNYEMAGRYFQRATQEKDATPEIFAELAEVYERSHHPQEAAEAADRALHSDPTCAPALLVCARLQRRRGEGWDEAERLLRSCLRTASREWRIQAGYELGLVLDRLGRYVEAMAAFLEAKALQRPDTTRYASELKIIRERLETMRTHLSPELVQGWLDSRESLQPFRRLALLGGHPRSGTTLLEQVLDSHPDIVSAEETTLFFDEAYYPLTRRLPDDAAMLLVLESARRDALLKSRTDYFRAVESLIGGALGDRLLIDKNPSLTFLVPPLLRIFPEIKFLVALRDPRDVCLSCFMQFMPLSQVSSAYLDLADTVQEYISLMRMWTTVSPLLRDRFIEVRYEDMVNDLETVAHRVLSFLDVPWDSQVLHFDRHARQKMVRSPTYADVAQPVFSRAVGRWRNYSKHLEPFLARLEPFVRAFGYQ